MRQKRRWAVQSAARKKARLAADKAAADIKSGAFTVPQNFDEPA